MAKVDVYTKSIKTLGAQGAVLTSGQAVTLKFPTGDRHATQITSHDQIVAIVREVAPPNALEQVDKNRAVKFEVESNGGRWTIQVAPKPGSWIVSIDPVESAPAAASTTTGSRPARISTAPPIEAEDMAIERGQYDGDSPPARGSGSLLLDQLTAAARKVRATDVFLVAGQASFQRVGGELAATSDRTAYDAELLARELGLVAPNDVRAAWSDAGGEHPAAVFAYGDGAGRVRVTLTRDHRGPGASLRLLMAEPPTLDELGLGAVVEWLHDRGLIMVAGPSGSGRTTTLAALVRRLGEARRRVVTFEDPIELVHVSAWISQRAMREHSASIGAGVAQAMREGADAIVVGEIQTAADAAAVVEAIAGGHLVLATMLAPRAHVGVERMLDRLPAEQRELARALVGDSLLGTIGPIVTRGGGRSFEVVGRNAAS